MRGAGSAAGTVAALLALLMAPVAAFAAIPLPVAEASPEATTAPTAPSGAIDTAHDSDVDARIATRIRAIFAAIDGLRGVTVSVQEGVVLLSGKVEGADAAAQAETIAGRVAGVVTVDNAIQREVAVDRTISSTVGSITEQARNLWRSLPLLGVAVLVAIAVIALFRWLAAWQGLWRRIAPNPFVAEVAASAVRFVGILAGLYFGLKILGATALLGALLGVGGVIGIAIGFAVRDTVDNYISSIMLSVRQPFRANDHVVIEGNEGRVIRLTSRATVLMTLDGNHLRIPNSTVFKAVILNYTRNPQRRFEFDLGVDADDDPVAAMAVGTGALGTMKSVLRSPEPSARIMEVGDSNIVLRFLGWVDQSSTDYDKARSLAISVVTAALEEKGFALPEPIYRLRIDPRSAALPGLSQVAVAGLKETSEAGAASPVAEPKVGARPVAPDDTAPDRHVADLVAEERAASGEADLLDASRPVE